MSKAKRKTPSVGRARSAPAPGPVVTVAAVDAAVDTAEAAGAELAAGPEGIVNLSGSFAPEPPRDLRYEGLVWIAEGSPAFDGGPPTARKLTWSATWEQWTESPW